MKNSLGITDATIESGQEQNEVEIKPDVEGINVTDLRQIWKK
jgi:hypothetical protein